MTARDDYPLLATAERLEEFGEAHQALDEIDRLRARIDRLRGELQEANRHIHHLNTFLRWLA